MSLAGSLEEFFAAQMEAWPLLRDGIDSLGRMRKRRLPTRWFEVEARHLPHRMASATAKVDPESVKSRPCFLCSANLPPEERGLPFDREFSLYCNPFPILDRHVTIVHRDHRPQQIEGYVGTMLDIAAALPGYFVLYNGAECGASAPDHLHFQAALRNVFPIGRPDARTDGLAIRLEDLDRQRLLDRLNRLLVGLRRITGRQPEPLINVAICWEEGKWRAFVFPRGKHRPESFYSGDFTLSPGSIDLCGILVVSVESDFEKLRAEDVTAVFEEVTLPSKQFRELAALDV